MTGIEFYELVRVKQHVKHAIESEPHIYTNKKRETGFAIPNKKTRSSARLSVATMK